LKTLSHTTTLLALALLTYVQGGAAQTVYRCGNEYTQTPCENGNAIRTDDSRSTSDRKAHQASVQKDKKTADALERQRLKEEQAAHQAATRAAAKEDQAAREAAHREAQEAAKKKKASQPVKIRAYASPKPATGSKSKD
jgi:hypothetical protein